MHQVRLHDGVRRGSKYRNNELLLLADPIRDQLGFLFGNPADIGRLDGQADGARQGNESLVDHASADEDKLEEGNFEPRFV